MNSGTFLKFAEFPERLRAPIIVNIQLELQFHFLGDGNSKTVSPRLAARFPDIPSTTRPTASEKTPVITFSTAKPQFEDAKMHGEMKYDEITPSLWAGRQPPNK